jgi:hypothetical protein
MEAKAALSPRRKQEPGSCESRSPSVVQPIPGIFVDER